MRRISIGTIGILIILFISISYSHALLILKENCKGESIVYDSVNKLSWVSNPKLFSADSYPELEAGVEQLLYYGSDRWRLADWDDFNGLENTLVSTGAEQLILFEGLGSLDFDYIVQGTFSTHDFGIGGRDTYNYLYMVLTHNTTTEIDGDWRLFDYYDYRCGAVDGGAWVVASIPEPTTMLLLGSGILGLAGFRRKRFKK